MFRSAERVGRLDWRALLPLRSGRDYRVIVNDIVLIEIATELILDVMKDVLR